MSTHIFESITERFGYGNYLDLKIIIDGKTNYINATKLCQLGGKKLKHWQENSSTKSLIDYYEDHTIELHGRNSDHVRPSYEVTQHNMKGLNKETQIIVVGTYYHKDLIVQIGRASCRERV